MRLGDRLEHLRHEPPRVLGLQGHPLRAPPSLGLDGRSLVRRGDQLHELREQGARPVRQLGGAAEQGEQLAFQHARLHRGDRFVPPDLLAPQIALEQRIVRFGDALDQLLGVALKPVPILGRDVHLVVLAGLRALLVHVTLLREQVDDPVELGAFAHGDFHRDHLRCEPLFDLGVELLEVGVLLVHQRDEEQARDLSLMDKEHADFEKVYTQKKERLTPKVIPVEIPVGEGPEFHGIINLFSKQCHMYKKGTKAGEYEEVDVPPEYRDRFERYSKELIERIAETDDTLLERYLGGEEIGRDEAIAAMKAGMSKGELFPLFCGAAELTYGTRALLSKLVELIPAPNERPPVEAQRWGSAERVTLKPEDTGRFVAQVFKTISEPHVGDVTFFRVY